MNRFTMDDDSISLDTEDDNTFISKLIGEMKNTFNNPDKRQVISLVFEASDSKGLNEINVNSHSTEITTDNCEKMETDDEKTEQVVDSIAESTEPVEAYNMQMDNIKSNVDVESNQTPEESNDDNKEELEDNEVDDDAKPRIVLCFRKPTTSTSPKNKKNGEDPAAVDRRTQRKKSAEVDEAELKRSARRRRSRDYGESVLQSAIARKEKSYNEASKPQRLTRQLKPTQKILDNLANAAAVHDRSRGRPSKSSEKQKNNDSDSDIYADDAAMQISADNDRVQRKHKLKNNAVKHAKRNVKRLKSSQSDVSKDSDSDLNPVQEIYDCDSNANKDDVAVQNKTNEEKNCRRSQRISSSRFREGDPFTNVDEVETPEPTLADQESMYPADPECSSVGAELIASKLCLCTQQTQLYASVTNKEMFCKAVDSVGNKLVGCNNLVNDEMSLLRSSTRVPYIVLCNVHRNRMLRHNCCPTCGVFCTQGTFVECDAKHHYHRDCQISVGTIRCCPHCGLSTPEHNINLKMYSAKKPVFLPQQKTLHPVAKITFQQNLHDDIKRSTSPLVPPESVQIPLTDDCPDETCYIDSLAYAIKDGDYKKLAHMLGSRNYSLMSPITFDDSSTILHYAAKIGNAAAVHMLLMAGMELDILDKNQNTPLMVAVLALKNDVVKYLIKAGSSIMFKGTDGMTALHLAAECGNLESCKLLIDSSVNRLEYVNCADDGGWTALVWACEHNHVNIAQYLLRKGADPLLRDLKQNIALHWSAFNGCEEIVQLLLNFKSDVNAVNTQDDTPLHIAARQSNYNAVIVILIRGGSVTAVNKVGETPLDCASEGSECYNIILLNAHLQPSITSSEIRSSIILTNDISHGKEQNPIQCITMIDSESKPTDFIYVSENCITSDINIDRKVTSLQSCTCEISCASENCLCGQISVRNWYDEDGRLNPEFNLADPPMIFECNQLCSCNVLTCTNRVVQRGLTQRFQLFRTENKGWGVQSLQMIPRGSFVCEYIGEIIDDVEAEQREDDSYVFDLDNRGSESFCIDAKSYGNVARFINHSCEPNLLPIKVFIDHHDLRFPRIAFFATRDILAKEELSFDYGEKFWLIKYKFFTCDCRSLSCKYSEDSINSTLESYHESLKNLDS